MADPVSTLQERLDDVGWESLDSENYPYLLFKWAQEATNEIRRLRNEIAAEAAMREASTAALDATLQALGDGR